MAAPRLGVSDAFEAFLASTPDHATAWMTAVEALDAGATREEVLSAILVGLPAVGQAVVGSRPAAIDACGRAD